jgi:hypothetical protein
MNRTCLFRVLMIGLITIGLSLLFLWSPWISAGYAERAVTGEFESSWEGVADGCGFNCQGCGVTASERVPFGYRVQIEYACGMLPADLPEYHQQADIFVSLFGTVHQLPGP